MSRSLQKHQTCVPTAGLPPRCSSWSSHRRDRTDFSWRPPLPCACLLQFLVHELPTDVITRTVEEGQRMLRPGGVLAFVDMNPGSIAAKSIHPVLATVLKSTEPFTDDYFQFDLEGCMRRVSERSVRV